jgi:hypothetical protein
MSLHKSFFRLLAVAALGFPAWNPVQAQFIQQGGKLASSCSSVALSADGNTAIIGSGSENSNEGGAWVFTRINGIWSQQGGKLVGTGAVGNADQGNSVAVSADGNTAIIGGDYDNSFAGAAWVFTRTHGTWSQQGDKLVGTGAIGSALQGHSVGISADGKMAIIGGPSDNSSAGAAWVWKRVNGNWTQWGTKLVGTGAVGGAAQGQSVALSGDGKTAFVGGYYDNFGIGAAWAFALTKGAWNQQGDKLVIQTSSSQGYSVALSADGNKAIVGAYYDDIGDGAAWIFTRTNGAWSQQASKLVGTGAVGKAFQGQSVALSADGNTAITGGPADNNYIGAAWVFIQNNLVWNQWAPKIGVTGGTSLGLAVALSADGNTAIIGGDGGAWIFQRTSYDIYAVAVKSGFVFHLTHLANSDEYNPSWSPDGRRIAFDVLPSAGGIQSIGIVDLLSGNTVMLRGGEGGNNARWSPNGRLLAFDHAPTGNPAVVVVPSFGGIPRTVVTDAETPDWSPDGKRLVYHRISDNSIRVTDLEGTSDQLVTYGVTPVWSPRGGWIVFTLNDGIIWKIQITYSGKPQGAPQLVASDAGWNSAPNWSKDGKTLVFGRDPTRHPYYPIAAEFDIYTVPEEGGTPTKLVGKDNFGDYDPCYSPRDLFVAFAGNTGAGYGGSMAWDLPCAKELNQDPQVESTDQQSKSPISLNSYPNPFNPATVIRYSLPTKSMVKLAVYNNVGQVITELVNGEQEGGYYEIRFDGSGLASGVYYCRLQAGTSGQTMKLLLLR